MTDDGRDLAYIQNKKTGQRMWMRQRNGVYVLDTLVAPPNYTKSFKNNDTNNQQLASMAQEEGKGSSLGFGRQGSQR